MKWIKRLIKRVVNTRSAYLYVDFYDSDGGTLIEIKKECSQRDIALFLSTLREHLNKGGVDL